MIHQQLNDQLNSLTDLLSVLSSHHYSEKIQHLGNASIGGHTRHIIELLQCVEVGYKTGTIDYINRKRNFALQTEQHQAIRAIKNLQKNLQQIDKILQVLAEGEEESMQQTVTTSYFREIVYNTEHCIHHLALIKVALIEMKLHLVDEHFGMAYSTIKFNASLVENNPS